MKSKLKPVRIFYFCYEGFKKIGKLNNHIQETVTWLAKLGNEVHFFNPNIIKPEFEDDVSIHLIPIINLPLIKWLSFDIFAFIQMTVQLLIQRPNVIYYRESSSLVPIIVSKLFSIPLIIEVNGWVLAELKDYGYSKWKLTTLKFNQSINYKFSNCLVPVSEGIKRLIIKHYTLNPSKIHVIDNGTNPDKYKPILVNEARKIIGINKNDQIVGFIGGCYPHHGIHHLINAAPIILKNIPNIKFIIAGDGVKLNDWKNLAKKNGVFDNFIFPGNVPFELAPYYINSFNICVAPWNEKFAGSPMKLFDYLACERFVITSRVYDVQLILNGNDCGIVIDVSDRHLFANTIIKYLENHDLLKEYGINGRNLVLKHYTWKQTSEKINTLIKKFL